VDKKHSIDNMKLAHPVDATLFGSIGAVSAHVSEELVTGFIGRRFEFSRVTEASLNPRYWEIYETRALLTANWKTDSSTSYMPERSQERNEKCRRIATWLLSRRTIGVPSVYQLTSVRCGDNFTMIFVAFVIQPHFP
jgi:hypothetical protein